MTRLGSTLAGGLAALLLWAAALVHAPPARANLPQEAAAAGTVVVAAHGESAALAGAAWSWLDRSGHAGIDAVAGNTVPGMAWQRTRADAIYPLTSAQALWIRFTVAAADPGTEHWYLEIPYPAVNHVTLYSANGSGGWSALRAGDLVPVAQWPVPHRHPVLPLMLRATGTPTDFYLQVQNPHSFSAPLRLIRESQLIQREQRTSLILGLYFGLAGLAVLMACVSAVSLREATHGLYALTVGLMALSQAALTGIAGLHLWPHASRWNDAASMTLPVLAVAALLWFVSHMVSLPQRSRRLHRLMLGLAASGVVVALGLDLVEPEQRFRLMVPFIAGACVCGIAATVWSWRRGDRHARWLLVGMTPVALAAAFPLARTAGLIPTSFWTLHAMQIGLAIELPILLVLLLLRSRQQLEHRRRLAGLERLDPATGLITAAVLTQRLMQAIDRSRRMGLQSTVLLIDVVNADAMRRHYGRAAADELPLRVAGRLLSAARGIDSVARISQHRFGMLMEGPLTPEEITAAGPRVVARCLMPFEDKPVQWKVEVRVAQAVVPNDGVDARVLLGELEVLLASVPSDSRRAVFNLGRPGQTRAAAAQAK